MKSFPPIVFAALVLAGCATLSQTSAPGMKIQQAYFAEVSASFVLLDAAGRYKDQCLAREEPLQQSCRLVVQKLRDIAIRAKEVRDLTDLALSMGSTDLIPVATRKLRELQAEMSQGLADAEPPKAPSPVPSQALPPEWVEPTS